MYDNDLKERTIKFKPRIKSNYNIYTAFTTEIFCAFSPIHCLQKLNIHSLLLLLKSPAGEGLWYCRWVTVLVKAFYHPLALQAGERKIKWKESKTMSTYCPLPPHGKDKLNEFITYQLHPVHPIIKFTSSFSTFSQTEIRFHSLKSTYCLSKAHYKLTFISSLQIGCTDISI